MVAVAAPPVKASFGRGMDLQNYKLALSLHEMLSAGQMQTAALGQLGPAAQQTPSERPSAGSSENGADDDGASMVKRSFQPYHSQSVPKSENLEAHASECVSNAPITTMMLRNIPNKYTQNTLLKEINSLGFATTYDFFYLPMDVHNRSNVGYAFINFVMPKDAERFRRVFSDHRFQRFHSRKIGSVCVAHVQGLDANLRHFENRAVTQARNDQYRPIVLQGQQRIGFEQAVLLAKVKDGAPKMGSSVAAAGGLQANANEDPRQGLEAAIRQLLSKRANPGQDACDAAAGPRATAAGQRGSGGDSTTDDRADIAQLLSLRTLLINQLSTSKEDSRRCTGGSLPVTPSTCRSDFGLTSPSLMDLQDGPAYINTSSFGFNSPTSTSAPMCNPWRVDKEPCSAAWQY